MKQVNFNFFLLYIFVLGFSSALAQDTGGGSAAPVVLSGTLQGWDGGEATVAAPSYGESEAFLGNIAEAPVAEDGSFELELPAEVPDELLYEIDASVICPEGGITLSPASFQGTGVFVLEVSQDETPTGIAMLASSEALVTQESANQGDQMVFRIYTAEPVSIQGTCIGADGTSQTYDQDFQEGWNTLVVTATAVSEGVPAFETTTADVPDGLNWFFVPHEGTGGGETGGGNTGGETDGGETGGGETGGG